MITEPTEATPLFALLPFKRESPTMSLRNFDIFLLLPLRGLISSRKGGCGSLQLIGNFTGFLPFTANGLTSVGFPTIFPVSFRFLQSTSLSHCTDLRDEALAFNVLITSALFVLLRPKSMVLYWCLVCIG